MKSLLKELVNQVDLKKSDGSDAGKTDVSSRAPATDVKFSLMRNTINSSGKVTGSDVADYLEKAHGINDEVDTVLYGLETSDGDVVKVYVNATQADAFEVEMKKMLGMEDDIEEAINDLATRFDIVDVVWPKGTGPDGDEESAESSELDLGTSADIGDPAHDDEPPAEEEPAEDDDMEVIASADDTSADEESDDEESDDNDDKSSSDEEPTKNDDDSDAELDVDSKPKKKDDKKPGKDDKHANLKGVGKNMKTTEGKLQVGWYVYGAGDKTIAGPVGEAEAKKICKEKGGDAKGFTTGYISDNEARRANETQGDNMTIGNKFLLRVLGESTLHEAGSEDRDGVLDGEAIPMDTQHRALANKLKWRLPKQVVQLFAMMGIPGVKLNSADAETSIAEAAEMLRTQVSVRRAFLDFFKAYATVKGFDVKAAQPVQESRLDEAKLKRGNALQKQLETVLVKLGLPEDLVSTTGPGVVGSALFRASKDIEDSGDLKLKLRNLAMRMGIKSSDVNAPLDAVTEAMDPMGADMYADAVMNLVSVLGVPDSAFSRQARMILAKEFRAVRDQTQVNALLSMVKQFTTRFEAAKSRVTRVQAPTAQGTIGTR